MEISQRSARIVSESICLSACREPVSRASNAIPGLSLALVVLLAAGLTGCGQNDVPVQANGDGAVPEAPASEAAAEPAAEAPVDGSAGLPGSGLASGRPYLVIRFADSSVDYQEELAAAVRRAVERKPNVAFDLVAVTPRASTAADLTENTEKAQQQATEVLQSLQSLGIGADRVSVGAWTGQPTKVNEIRLYIR